MTLFPIDNISVTQTATQADIQLIDFQLNAIEGNASVVLMDTTGRAVKSLVIRIPPDIYSQWQADDNFIVNYILQRLVSS
jgi:hypothetical protein